MPRILIVDDDELLRASIADILVDAGYHVAEASDGVQALNILRDYGDVDAVLSDVRMPGMDGVAFLREVKRMHPYTAVVMLTGHGTVDTAVQAMRDGATNYLLKPANKEQLLESVEEALEQRRAKQDQQSLMDQVASGLRQLGIVHQPESQPPIERFLKVRELTIDQHRLVALFQDQPMELTPTEFDILYCLVQARGRVVKFEEIAYRIQGVHTERDEARSLISTHISNLRNKLREAGCEHYLVNSRGRGYLIEVEA